MKILLISGHGAGDPGAQGCGYSEANLTRELVNLVAPKLRSYGITVDVYDQNRNAYADAQRGLLRPGTYDYVFEIHFNAGGGHGTEIHITTIEAGDAVEKAVLKNLEAYFTNRGVKRTDFSVIRTLKNQGVSSALLETCFIDSKVDMNTYQAHKSKIAEAIASGIAQGFGMNKKAEMAKTKGWEQHGSEYMYVCEDGSYKKSGWLKLSDGSYYFNSDGWMCKGWLKLDNGSFYLDPKTGRCAKSCILTINGGQLCFDDTGRAAKNTVIDGVYYNQYGRAEDRKTCPCCGQEIKK